MPLPKRDSSSIGGRPSLLQRNSLVSGNLLTTPLHRSSAMTGSNSGARKSFLPKLNAAAGEGTSRVRKSTEFGRGRLSAAAARSSFATAARGALASASNRQMMKTPEKSILLNAPSSAQSARLSSVSSRASTSVFKKKDTRPISDPAFKKSCVDNIFKFLIENDYQSIDVSFNRKSITHPTTKDFVAMFTFIYSKLCMFEYQMPSRFDEEIPKLLKKIGYPTVLPKSTFASIGSQHTMPAILAMLSWLSALAQDTLHWDIKDLAFPGDFESPYLPQWNDINAVFDIMQQDSDDHVTDVFQNYKIQYEEESGVSEDQIINSREELNSLLDEEQRLSYELQNVPPLGERNEMIANDIVSLKTFQKKLHAKLQSVGSERENLDVQVEGMRARLNQLNAECERVKEMRQIQQYTPEEVRSIKNHVLSYSDTMQQMKDQLKDINEKVWDRERAVVSAKNELGQAVIAYNNNEAASALGYIDTMAANGFDRLERSEVVSLSEAAEEMVRSKRRALVELVEKKRSMERERDDITQQNNMKAQQIIRLESRINYVKDDLECCHQENSTEESALQARIEELNQAIATARRGMDGAGLEYSTQELERVKKQESDVKQFVEGKIASGSSCLRKMIGAMEQKVEWERRQAEQTVETVRGAVERARQKHSVKHVTS